MIQSNVQLAEPFLSIQECIELAILVLGCIGVSLAYWRCRIADRQSKIAQENLINEQFRTAVSLLGHDDMTVRLGGVSSLVEMARLYPEVCHIRVMALFASFLTYPPRYRGGHNNGKIDTGSADTCEIINAINNRTEEQKRIEENAQFDLNEKLLDTNFPLINQKIQFRREIPSLYPSASPSPAR